MLREERRDDELREEAGLHPLDQPPRQLPDSGSPNSIAHISPSPRTSRTTSNSSTSGRVSSSSCSPSRAVCSTRSLLVELVQRREAGRHRELVRRERRAVRDRVLHRVVDRLVHGARHQQRADRDVAARERLRDRNEIGLEPPVLEREQLAGAAEAGLHLVDAEERAVACGRAPARPRGSRRAAACTPFPWTGSTRKSATSSRPELAARARRGRRTAPGRSRAAAAGSAR